MNKVFIAQFFQKRLRNESGFSLIETMVIGTILVLMMVAFTSYMFQQARQQRNQATFENITQLKSNLVDQASQPDMIINSEQLTFPKKK